MFKFLQVYPGEQFGLDWVDFKPERRTVMIVHGFMSHSNASWVRDMTSAFLEWVSSLLSFYLSIHHLYNDLVINIKLKTGYQDVEWMEECHVFSSITYKA